jgi:hypothetical protein
MHVLPLSADFQHFGCVSEVSDPAHGEFFR